MISAVVVAQLVERSPPTPEIRGSNPGIGKFLFDYCQLRRKDKINQKETGEGPFFKKN